MREKSSVLVRYRTSPPKYGYSRLSVAMVIHTAALCSMKYHHRRRVRRQHALPACRTPPCEPVPAVGAGRHALGGIVRLSAAAAANISSVSLTLPSYVNVRTYVRHRPRNRGGSTFPHFLRQIGESREKSWHPDFRFLNLVWV